MNEGNERTGKSGNTQQEVTKLHRRTTALWLVVVALGVALVSTVSYGYLTLREHNIQLSQLPGIGSSLAALGERLEAAEARLSAWAADQDRLEQRVAKLDRKLRYNRELARTQAEKLAGEVQERLEAKLAEHTEAIDARLSRVETAQDAERAHRARLQEEIAAVRRNTASDLARLHQEVARSEGNLDALARQIDRQRVDFELTKGKTRELAPGISLRITKTNVRFQRVKGWLWLLPARRTLWVRELGVQQALVFYNKDGRGPNELVLTRVTKDAAIGYLMVPVEQSVAVSAGSAEAAEEAGAVVPVLLGE